jgi:hypothetical protein
MRNCFQNGKGSTCAIIALVALSACATTPGPVEVRTVTVNVPVATSCVHASDIPAVPAKIGDQLNGDSVHDLDLVAASAIRLRATLDIALSLLGACVTP